jgi:endonuclease-3 related protein
MMTNHIATRLKEIYDRLWQAYGPQQWWPADGPLEVMVGAVLTQNTTWRGAEKAIANLKRSGLLTVDSLHAISGEKLARVIRPAGYFNVKARRLKNLIELLANDYSGDLQAMGRVETEHLRRELLEVKGIGPETADSILLYAFGRSVFVVDSYTHRVVNRHRLIGQSAAYQELQELFTEHLPLDPALFNEYHALLVKVGKEHCQQQPRCADCPLEPLLPRQRGGQ